MIVKSNYHIFLNPLHWFAVKKVDVAFFGHNWINSDLIDLGNKSSTCHSWCWRRQPLLAVRLVRAALVGGGGVIASIVATECAHTKQTFHGTRLWNGLIEVEEAVAANVHRAGTRLDIESVYAQYWGTCQVLDRVLVLNRLVQMTFVWCTRILFTFEITVFFDRFLNLWIKILECFFFN